VDEAAKGALDVDRTEHKIGFVYVLENEYMPEIVKIGFTKRLSEVRAQELSRPTGVPVRFTVPFRMATSHPWEVEQRTLLALESVRVPKDEETGNSKEFFKTSADQAIATVRRAAREANGIESWQCDAMSLLRTEVR
jgi:hypothetical protein